MAHNHHRQFDYNNPRRLQQDKYSRWKIHPTTETGRERVNQPRNPYAYNAGYQPARQPSCWEPSCWEPPSFADEPDPRRIHTVGYRGRFHDRGDRRQRQGFEEYPWRHQQPQSGRADQPPQFDRTLSHRKAPLHVVAPPRVGSKHLPHQSRDFIGSGQQCGLPNNPHLKVRSPCPAQLAVVSDYNEKLRIYRLEQAALLAELNAWFEENIDEEHLVEDVPNNVAHNGGVTLEVPNDESSEEIVKPYDESLEEIVMMDNMPPQVLVGAYDEKIDDLSVPTPKELEPDLHESAEKREEKLMVLDNDEELSQKLVEAMAEKTMVHNDKTGDPLDPTHRELKIKGVVRKGFYEENLMEEYVSCYENLNQILIKSLVNRRTRATMVTSKISKSHIIFTCIMESWCCSSIQSLIHNHQWACAFDPGGDTSITRLLLSTLFVTLWFPP